LLYLEIKYPRTNPQITAIVSTTQITAGFAPLGITNWNKKINTTVTDKTQVVRKIVITTNLAPRKISNNPIAIKMAPKKTL
jgi:hypothetical protein